MIYLQITEYERAADPGMKQAKETGCSGMASMHCRESVGCTVLVAKVCLHGSPEWLG